MVAPAIAAAAIMGGASLAGGLMGNAGNAKQAQKNRDFQEHMSNTAYQRGMADMKAAGLNPILAAYKGGASTPGGAQAQVTDVLSPAVQAGLNTVSTAQQVATGKAQESLTNETIFKVRQDILQSKASTNLTESQVDQVTAQIVKIKEEAKYVAAQTTQAISSAKGIDSKTRGTDLDNIQKTIMGKFYQSADFARIAKEIGIPMATFYTLAQKALGVKVQYQPNTSGEKKPLWHFKIRSNEE